jgi:V8-like Glu-specific endopeptidase
MVVNLRGEDRRQLMAILTRVGPLQNERGRREILKNAGLEQLVPMINFEGDAFTTVSSIVSYLGDYGRVSYAHEALGLFLNTVKEFTGEAEQNRTFIDWLLRDYNMMTPSVNSLSIDNWRGREQPADVYEKIIGENTLRSIAFLARGLEVARSVAYIKNVSNGEKSWSGTGFLIAPDLLLTNNHVIPDANNLSGTRFQFNYELDFSGKQQDTEEYKFKNNGIFHTNTKLDYSVVQLESVLEPEIEPGKKWGWLPLTSRDIQRDSRANIIQHPSGQPKQIALQNNLVQYVGGNVLQYVTPTLPGSSGSPVFNDLWEVVAVHHAGGNIPEPTTQRWYFRNEGILISSILADLPAEIRQRLPN